MGSDRDRHSPSKSHGTTDCTIFFRLVFLLYSKLSGMSSSSTVGGLTGTDSGRGPTSGTQYTLPLLGGRLSQKQEKH